MLTIGTDPEYILVDKYGHIKGASNYDFFGSTSRHAEIGRDHAGTPVEIRPRPVKLTQVEKLCKHIDILVKKINDFCQTRQLSLYAGACYQKTCPIGGHIHFGGKELQQYSDKKARHREKILKLLDCYFTPITNLLLDTSDMRYRLNTSYGKLSSYENKSYGFEYRTPYSFLVSPYVTRAFFALAALIGYHYRKLKIPNGILQSVRYCYRNTREMHQLKETAYPSIKRDILKMMKWKSPNPKLNSHIVSLFSLIERKKKYNTLNVFENYKFKSAVIAKEREKYMRVIFSEDDHMRDIGRFVVERVKNKCKGTVFLYGVGMRGKDHVGRNEQGEEVVYENGVKETMEDTVFLSNDLPKFTNLPNKVNQIYKSYGSGRERANTIGLSRTLRGHMINYNAYRSFLVDYLNKLKLS